MKIRELNKRLSEIGDKGAKRTKYKWKEIEGKLSDKKSLCCKVPIIILGGANDDIGVCSKCKKFTIDELKQGRLSFNRYQKFKKIADDALYDFDSKKTNNYLTPRNRGNNKQSKK